MSDATTERARLAHALRERLALEAELGAEPAISPSRLRAFRRAAERDASSGRSPNEPASGAPDSRPERVGEARATAATETRRADLSRADLGSIDDAGESLERQERQARLDELAQEIAPCTRCALAAGRTQTVFGVGDPCARLLFVGEAPGREEDRRGEPFVGPAGQLLDRIIQAMGLARADVYIANVCKCRPHQNRTPLPAEMAACLPFLRRQIEIIRPEVICALGSVAARGLLQTELSVGRLRGAFHEFEGIPVRVTYHPAYLLRAPEEKKKTWIDVQAVMAFLDETASDRS